MPIPTGTATCWRHCTAYRQERSGAGTQPNVPGVFQPTLFSPKAKQQVETYPGSEQIESFPQGGEIQNGDTGNHQNIPPTGGVGYINRLQGCVLPYPYTGTVQEISEISCPGSDIPIQSTGLWSVHSTLEFTVVAKEVKLMAIHKGIRIHQYLDDWLVRARSYRACLQHTQILIKICQKLGWLVNLDKSELEPKQIFDFVGYQFDLKTGRVRPTPDRWQSLQDKILEILLLPACSVRQFMSLIGLLTATEKQVHLGRLHVRPIQWHLKRHWRIPESLEKVIPIPSSLHPHLQWWLQEDNILTGQPLHPIKHDLQIFTDASKEGWDAHLNEHTARGIWSLPESKLHINYLELKAVFLALKEFQSLCAYKIELVATDNTTVVSYINKEGGMRSGTLCALLWRILTWCTRHQVALRVRHIPGRLNMVADKLSRLGQTILTELVPPSRGFPNNMQQVAPTSNRLVCHEVQQQVTSVCVTSTGFPGSSSRCTQSPMRGSGCLCLPTSSHLGQSAGEITGLPLQENHSVAPGWPNMPWFWDLVTMSSQIPLSLPNLPNLLTQPFNQIPHRNLTNLNIYAWLLEPQQSKSRASLKQWQQGLRLLKEDQPDPSMRQSGPFLQSGASLIRWTSGHPL